MGPTQPAHLTRCFFASWLATLSTLATGCSSPPASAGDSGSKAAATASESPPDAVEPAPVDVPAVTRTAFHPFAPGSIRLSAPYDGEPLVTTTLDEGLKVEDYVLGEGEPVVEGSYVTFHYVGYMDDGFVYESSRRRKRPYSFFVGAKQALAGWDLGLRGMKVGGHRRLDVPPALAFGDRGRGPQVPPGSTIVYTIELLAARAPFAAPLELAKLEALAEKTSGEQLRPPKAKADRSVEMEDDVFVHFAQFDAAGELRDGTHRTRVPRRLRVGPTAWTAKLAGMRVGEIRRVRHDGATYLVELMGLDEARSTPKD